MTSIERATSTSNARDDFWEIGQGPGKPYNTTHAYHDTHRGTVGDVRCPTRSR